MIAKSAEEKTNDVAEEIVLATRQDNYHSAVKLKKLIEILTAYAEERVKEAHAEWLKDQCLDDVTNRARAEAVKEQIEKDAHIAKESYLDTTCKVDSHCGIVAEYAGIKILRQLSPAETKNP